MKTTIHIWNENTAQAGQDAHEDRGGDSTAYTFDNAEDAAAFVKGLRETKAPAGRDLFNARMAKTIESYF